jgi:hypothetical protein
MGLQHHHHQQAIGKYVKEISSCIFYITWWWRSTKAETCSNKKFNVVVAGGLQFLTSSAGIATCYVLDGPGIESRWGEFFSTRPNRPWGPPSLLYNGYPVLPGGKARKTCTVNSVNRIAFNRNDNPVHPL